MKRIKKKNPTAYEFLKNTMKSISVVGPQEENTF